MICEIINPSDAYTVEVNDFVVGGVAIAILGRGQYGLKSLETDDSTPVLFGWEEWLKENGIDDLGQYIKAHEKDIADVLDSILIGNGADRQEVADTIALIPEEKRNEWLEGRHDRKRSSMNDIGAYAKSLAAKMRNV